MFNIGDTLPNFVAVTTKGQLNFFKYKEGSWCVLFSHPAAYTPVCTTELGQVARMYNEFEKRNVKVLAVSIDDIKDHEKWIHDIEQVAQMQGKSDGFPFPIIADETRELSKTYGLLDYSVAHPKKGKPASGRGLYIIDPSNTVRALLVYPSSVGRDFQEVLRVIDSLQMADQHSVVTPSGWRQGSKVIVRPDVSDDDAKKEFGSNIEHVRLPSGKGYMRMTKITPAA